MNRKLILVTLTTFALFLVACAGADSAAPVLEITSTFEDVSLPDEVDVHTVASIMDRGDVYLVDVREQWEYDEGHIPGITLIPMNEVPGRLDEIPRDKTVVLTCRSGNRSGQTSEYLRQSGFDNVHNMVGGILAWDAEGYEVVR